METKEQNETKDKAMHFTELRNAVKFNRVSMMRIGEMKM
jgi:hypothetical protein